MTITPLPSDLDHLDWLARANVNDWQGKVVLDLGCGTGYVCEWSKKQGAEMAIGVDIVEPPVAAGKAPELWDFLKADLEDPEFWDGLKAQLGDRSVDIILAFDIVEHLASPWDFAERCYEILGSRGILVLTTPNVNSWERLLRPKTWSGARDPQHKTLFSAYSLSFLLARSSFVIRHLASPVRKARMLSGVLPQIGGQLLSVCSKE